MRWSGVRISGGSPKSTLDECAFSFPTEIKQSILFPCYARRTPFYGLTLRFENKFVHSAITASPLDSPTNLRGGTPNDNSTNSDNGFVFLYYKKMRCKASHFVGTDEHEQRESQARSMRPDWRVKGSPRNAWLQLRCIKSLNMHIKKQQHSLLFSWCVLRDS